MDYGGLILETIRQYCECTKPLVLQGRLAEAILWLANQERTFHAFRNPVHPVLRDEVSKLALVISDLRLKCFVNAGKNGRIMSREDAKKEIDLCLCAIEKQLEPVKGAVSCYGETADT